MSTVDSAQTVAAAQAATPKRNPSTQNEPALLVESVWKIFGRRADKIVGTPLEKLSTPDIRDKTSCVVAVRDVSFEVQQGEIFVVMGLSGSGKSTLIRTLNGLQPPTSGRVLIHGENLAAAKGADLRRIRRERVSMVFQHFALFPHRTVLDNAAYGLETQGVSKAERRARAHQALELCGLEGWDSHYPGELSGGMRQRVGLARALAADTDILLMDEAFSALDPLIRREMQDQLRELQHKLGKTIVFITHDLNEAMRLGDRIAMMRNGVVEQIGTAAEILTNPASEYVAKFVADVDRNRVVTAEAIMSPAPVVLTADASGAAARERMSATAAQQALVVDDLGLLAGAVRAADMDATGAHSTLRSALVSIDSVPAETLIADLCGHAAISVDPVPVVDGERRLLGVVTRDALLAALAGDPNEHDVESPND